MHTLEIACFSATAAMAAAAAGAHRIELCDNIAEGGTTPSWGTIATVLQHVAVPVFPIIRPRGGDFLYTNYEFAIMLEDVKMCSQLGCKGVVLGLLMSDGSIDVTRTTALVEAAGPMEVTFHRAFDRALNPLQALENVIQTGCKRILSSGQKPHAVDGKHLLKILVQQAENRIIVMPGSGVRSHNIAALATYTGATELHSSASMLWPSHMQFQVNDMQEQLQTAGIDSAEIKSMLHMLQQLSS